MVYNNIIGGDEGNRTPGLLVANETLSRTELRPHLIIYTNLLYISCFKLQSNSLFINEMQILTDTHQPLQNFSWLPSARLVMKHYFNQSQSIGENYLFRLTYTNTSVNLIHIYDILIISNRHYHDYLPQLCNVRAVDKVYQYENGQWIPHAWIHRARTQSCTVLSCHGDKNKRAEFIHIQEYRN